MNATPDDDKPTPEMLELTKLLARADHLRTNRVPWITNCLIAFIREFEQAGCACQEGFDLIKEGIAQLRLAIPRYVCQWCEARGKLVNGCLCGGRGWFAENEVAKCNAAMHRAKLLNSGDKRSLGKIIRDLGKDLPQGGEGENVN